MEQTPKTSFIPKQSMNTAPSQKRRHRSFNVLGFIAMVLFLGSLVLSVGVFFYKQYSDNKLTALKQELAESRSSFQQGDIESIRELEQRLQSAYFLMNQHLSVSSLLDALERRTLQNVQFTSFAYERRSSGNASVNLGGKSSRFNTVALQGTEFTSESAFESSLFSDINIVIEEETLLEHVVFQAHAEINEGVIAYLVLPETGATEEGSSGETIVEPEGSSLESDDLGTTTDEVEDDGEEDSPGVTEEAS